MKQFCCECGFTVKWTAVDPDQDFPLINALIQEHENKGHEEVSPWEATQIRSRTQRATEEGREKLRASYRKRKGSSMGNVEPIMDPQRKALTKLLDSGVLS